jgi:hypothetical protein
VNDLEVVASACLPSSSEWRIFLSSLTRTSLCIDIVASPSRSFFSVCPLENSMPMQTNAKLMEMQQQLVMTALGAVLSLFVFHHLPEVRSIVRSRTLLDFFVCPFRRSHFP